jgi:radical SAM superfamily enzyme YgiQ (UPF0313 family)
LPKMMAILFDGFRNKRDKFLEKLSSLAGIYAPQYHQGKPIYRQWAKDLDSFPIASAILTRDTELGGLYLIEVGRGCNWGCRFCMVSNTFSPVRFRSMESLLNQAEEGLNYRKSLGLVGPAVTDHPQIDELVTRLRQLGARLSISSLRMKPLSPVVIQCLAEGKAQSVSFAPEAGSARLRRLIKKGLSEDDIMKAINMTAGTGIKHIKLYFMIGLPTETEEDIEDIIRITTDGKSIIDRKRSGMRITVKVAPFVPKANTPLQRLPMAPVGTLNSRMSMIKTGLQRRGIRVKGESLAWSEVQAVLSRGDRNIAGALAKMEEASLSGWRVSVDKQQIDVEFYAHGEWPAGQKLPWSIINPRMKKSEPEFELKSTLGVTPG